jgi:TolB-like protein/Flp pilus assembly protein TadD
VSASTRSYSPTPDAVEVKAELDRILASRAFWHAEGLSRFLQYVVDETLAGRADAIKEYSIGVAVFDRGGSFDPKADTIVRVQARRLRARLAQYYANSGDTGAVVIELPKGRYVPAFIPRPRVSEQQPEIPASLKPGFVSRFGRPRMILLVAGIAGFGLLAAVGTLLRRGNPADGPAAFEAIAVLPFESLSSGPDQQYIADGLTETLITNLGQASALRVIARTSVNQYRGTKKPVREIARELNVDAVVEGTITQAGDRLRVTANLIQVSPEKHLWARHYERNLGDVLALQNEIADAIAAGIHVSLTPRQQSRLQRSRPVNPDAQLAYWRALYFLQGRRDRDSAVKSLDYSQRSVAIDPAYASAQAALARSYLMLSNLGAAFPSELMAAARSAAQTAIALDDDLAEGHVALGSILLAYDWDWAGAEREARRAVSLNPSSADAQLLLANYLAAIGRTGEAIDTIKRARELDPFSFYINRNVGRILYFARKYDEALKELRQAAEMQPGSPAVQNWIAMSCLKKGLFDAAVAADMRELRALYPLSAIHLNTLQTGYSGDGLPGYWKKVRELLLAMPPRDVHRSYHLAEVNAFIGDRDEAFRWLQKAYEERTGHMPWIKVTPSLDALRPDPRFAKLLRLMGLAE